jgi:predicted nucleic acid-binding protein
VPGCYSFDTNCLVAILSEWHPHHKDSVGALLEISKQRDNELVLAAHTLFECFSVLTRMPKPHRIEPEAARIAIGDAFGPARRAVPDLELYDAILEACVASGFAGGLAYDALIAHTVHRHGATHLITWNTRHLERVAPKGLHVLRPDQVLL